MRIKIKRSTTYNFGGAVSYGLQQVRKTPKTTHGQTIINWTTHVEGGKKELSFEDHHNNTVELLSFEKDAQTLTVTSQGEIDIAETNGVLGPHEGRAPLWLYMRPTPLTRPGAGVRALAKKASGDTSLELLHNLSNVIGETVSYQLGSSAADGTAEEALAAGKGVCQDHTHIFLAAARSLGFPARYVSGYLMMDGQVDQDAMHAWAEAHVDGLGWVGFDVSNGISPDQRYVRVASGLDYSDAAPVTGIQAGAVEEHLDVKIQVAGQSQS